MYVTYARDCRNLLWSPNFLWTYLWSPLKEATSATSDAVVCDIDQVIVDDTCVYCRINQVAINGACQDCSNDEVRNEAGQCETDERSYTVYNMIIQTEMKTADLSDEIWNLGSDEFENLSTNLTTTVESLILRSSYGGTFKEAIITRFEKDIGRANSLNVDIDFGFLDQNDNQVFVDAINAISAESSELTEADYTGKIRLL